jgi:AraC-like DNA-binding protein
MGTPELAVIGLAGSGIGTAMGLPMVWPAVRRSIEFRLMGAGLIGLSLIAAMVSARVIGLLPATSGVNHAINLAGLLSYPLVYLYIRCATGRPMGVAPGWWLWTPGGAYAAVVIVRSAAGVDTRVPFAWLLPVLLAFTLLCARALIQRRGDRPTLLLRAEWLVAFLVILNAAQIVRMLFGHIALVPMLIPLVVSGGFVALVGLVAWRTANQEPVVAVATGPRYARSSLDDPTAKAVLERIERALSKDRLFADADLTLARLASSIGSTPHQVSEVLNRYANITFHELLNQRRIADVKAQLLDPESDRYTIEGIGASAGFGSRSALYAAFRRLEGVTPSEFRGRQGRRVP